MNQIDESLDNLAGFGLSAEVYGVFWNQIYFHRNFFVRNYLTYMNSQKLRL
jgi:hypothetical protein